MRLIRSKVFRAIPELDRFSDDQCRRFVSAANSSWRRRLLRWIIVGLAGLIGAIGACALIVPTNLWIQNLLRVDDLGGAIIALIVGSLAFALGLLPTLILRDSLLRLTIRRLIRRCGACPRCHYSLLGMRIAGDHSIICPECGLKIDVDASLGELTTDAEGAAVYKPEIVREHEVMKQRRRRRHKRFFQGVAAAVALFLLSATGWWLWLVNQAHRAARDRTAVQQIHQVQLGMWPAAAAANAAAEFERYQALIKACADAQGATNVPGLAQAPVATYFEASTLIPGADSKAFDKQNGEGSFDACRKFTLAVLRQSRESGLTRDLRSLLDMQGPIRPMAPEGDEPFVSVLIPDLGHARAAARFNGARMIDALQSGDRAEYMEALEENLAIARIVERQGLLIDRLVAIAIDSLTMHRITEDAPKFPDAQWQQAALDALGRRWDHAPLFKSFEIERLAGLDSIAWFFSNPSRVAKGNLGLGCDAFGFGNATPGSVGTYQHNRAAYSTMFDSVIAAAKSPPTSRPPMAVAPTGLVIVDQLVPSLGRVLSSDDNNIYEQRMCALNLASDLFTLRNGRPPATPDELLPLLPNPSAAIDPFSEKPFRFLFNADPKTGTPSLRIQDGEDDEARPGTPSKPKAAQKPAPKPGK